MNRLKLFWGSRGVRKFRRDRMAVGASFIIGLYFLVALSVALFGLVEVTDTKSRVLPNRFPGFSEEPTQEERFAFARWYWDAHFQSTFKDGRDFGSEEDFRRVIDDELSLGARKIVDGTMSEVLAVHAELAEAFESFESTWFETQDMADEVLAIDEEIAEMQAAGEEVPADLVEEGDEYRAELADLETRSVGELEVVEAAILALQPIPEGWDGFVYRLQTLLGSDSKGASISAQATYSIKIAFQIGLITAIFSVLIGSLLGAAAAYFGGWVDHAVMWVVSVLSSIPYLVLLVVIAYMFTGTMFDNQDKPALALVPVYVAFVGVFWVSTCRLVRGEVLKIKELEYVQAATSVGFSRFYILVKHVIPNTAHLMFIQFSLLFIGAIKSEVILSFLGLGVKGQSSWGIMINHGRDGVTSFFFWEVGAATVFMFVLVLAFNVVSDALQDAFDPKHVG